MPQAAQRSSEAQEWIENWRAGGAGADEAEEVEAEAMNPFASFKWPWQNVSSACNIRNCIPQSPQSPYVEMIVNSCYSSECTESPKP